MGRLWPLVLPIVALLAVGAAAFIVLRDRGEPQGLQLDAPQDDATVAATPMRAATPLARAGDVCQGTVKRPAPGEPARFDAVYSKQQVVMGIHVVGSADVDDEAFDEARTTIERVFRKKELLEPLVAEGAYVIIAAADQGVLDLPEFGCLERQVGASAFEHVCGVADRADYPVATVNELDLIGDRSGPCRGLNILYHELGHLVHGWSLSPDEYIQTRLLYQDALTAGKYRDDYARTNFNEYFAEATQAYFLTQDTGGRRGRSWLERYDPAVAAFVASVYEP